MTPEQAIEAIQQATDIFVQALMSKSAEGSDGHTQQFRIAKEDALTAMQQILGTEHVANIHVSEEGRKVTLGIDHEVTTMADLQMASEFSHNDNNNGNF